MTDVVTYLRGCDEPWTRYRTLVDLEGRGAGDPEVAATRRELIDHPMIHDLVELLSPYPWRPLTRHNDAAYPLYALATLTEFGLTAVDCGLDHIAKSLLQRQSDEGAFLSLVNVPKAFGGSGEDEWTWIACDAPTVLVTLVRLGYGEDPRVERALSHLADLAVDNGYRCRAAAHLGRFKGPGKRSDPCPIANVYALKALVEHDAYRESDATRRAAESLLDHYAGRGSVRNYMFGVGTDFHKIKFPFVWYDILHVLDVLCRLPLVHGDARFLEMVAHLAGVADENGRYTATSMYRAWKGWPFADKKTPSPWLTFLAHRIMRRARMSA